MRVRERATENLMEKMKGDRDHPSHTHTLYLPNLTRQHTRQHMLIADQMWTMKEREGEGREKEMGEREVEVKREIL